MDDLKEKKILVLGGNGMAGHTISLYLKEAGFCVTTYGHRGDVDLVGDARDFNALKKIVVSGAYDVVINAIGLLNQNAENNLADAIALNSYLPHFLSKILKDSTTKIIHMSTDCVFSGEKGGYSECSIPDGTTFYDRTKALGELNNARDLTFRNSIIGPDINPEGLGLFNWFMKQKNEIKGYTQAIWTGVTTLTLAKAMEQAIHEDLCGLYHLVNNDKISKFELLRLFNHYFKDNKLTITPTASVICDKSLINNRNDFTFVVPSYETMIKEMKEWIGAHEEIYPDYFFNEYLEV